jgi:hypothetical protein
MKIKIGKREFTPPFEYQTGWRFGDPQIVDADGQEVCYPDPEPDTNLLGQFLADALNQSVWRVINSEEDLPEEAGTYLVTRIDFQTNEPFVEVSTFDLKNGFADWGLEKVVAWKSLPSPYEPVNG